MLKSIKVTMALPQSAGHEQSLANPVSPDRAVRLATTPFQRVSGRKYGRTARSSSWARG
jgi:hypothetical protein